jgi:hypothetical protein
MLSAARSLFLLVPLGWVPRGLAAPLGDYCISRVAHTPGVQVASSPKQSARVLLPIEDRDWEVLRVRVDTLLLKRISTATVVATLRAPQYDFGTIQALALTRDAWLWIDGQQADYVAHLDLSVVPPRFDHLRALPELYEHPCSWWQRFWGNCRLAQGTFSPLLDRVFVAGYSSHGWGSSELVSLEMMGGKAKELDGVAPEARLLYPEFEFPRLGGVLLRSRDDSLFFYDGSKTKILLQGESALAPGRQTPWSIHSTRSGRVYLTNAGRQQDPFLREVLRESLGAEMVVPPALAKGWLSLFQYSDQDPLWGITREAIFLNDRGTLRLIAQVRENADIVGPAGIEQESEGAIVFRVQDRTSTRSQSYRLGRSPARGACTMPVTGTALWLTP